MSPREKAVSYTHLAGHMLAEEVVDVTTGEIIAEAGTVVSQELADTCLLYTSRCV